MASEDTASARLARVVGSVLGAAIGDALGHPTEFLSAAAIRARWGPAGITGYVLRWDGPDGPFAPFTDDTQMAEVVLRSLLESRAAGEELFPAMERMARGLVGWADAPAGGHRAPGNACLRGARQLARGRPWHEGEVEAGGCGSVIRAWPVGLVFADDPARAETWAVAQSFLTHGHPMALASSAALALGVAAAVRGEPVAAVLAHVVEVAGRHDGRTGRLAAATLDEARRGVPPEVVLERLLGWNAQEALAAALYVVARHPDDPRAALLEASNSSGDSDSIATIVGALLGALRGIDALPREWVDGVERSRELVALARSVVAPGATAALEP